MNISKQLFVAVRFDIVFGKAYGLVPRPFISQLNGKNRFLISEKIRYASERKTKLIVKPQTL